MVSRTLVGARRNTATLGVWPIENLFPEFRELWPGSPVMPYGDMHQSFTGTHVRWFVDNFPMFVPSFSILSVHCVARGLRASFLYKCPASRGGSLQQYGLLVFLNYLQQSLLL